MNDDDDEVELVFLDRKSSPTTPAGTINETNSQEHKEGVVVTTNITVTRDGF